MLKSIQQRDLDRNRWVKITMAVILGIIIFSMVITLIPGLMNGTTDQTSPDAIASVGGTEHHRCSTSSSNSTRSRGASTIPPMLEAGLCQASPRQMIFQRALEFEADRLGIRVTPEEQTERIKEILPDSLGRQHLAERSLRQRSADAQYGHVRRAV